MDNAVENPTGPNKKILIIGGAVLLFFLVLILILVAVSKKKTTTQNTTGSTSTSQSNGFLGSTQSSGSNPNGTQSQINPATLNGKTDSTYAISASTLAWIDSQRNTSGVYNQGITCTKSSCQKPETSFTSGLGVMWGAFQYYKKSLNLQTLSQIKTDLKVYTNKDVVRTIQNSTWNCRLMYDLWNSTEFSASDKQRIENICFDSNPYSLLMASIPESTSVTDEQITSMLNDATKPDPALTNLKDYHLSTFAPNSSDASIRYLWKKDKEDLNQAKKYFYFSIQAYKKSSDQNPPDLATLGIAALDLYKATLDNKYLSYSYKIYAKVSTPTPMKCEMSDCMQLLIFSQDLYNLIKENKYQDMATNMRSILINNFFDFKGYPGLVQNKGAFYSKSGSDKYYYSIYNNGLLVGLMAK
jgi:hypothetical protein